jgi:hypothetical protein
MPRTRVLVIAMVLAVTGCQSEDSDPAGRPGATPDPATIRSGLASLFAGDHPGSRENIEGKCFAEALTAMLSPNQLRKAGVLDASYDVVADPPPLPDELAGHWAMAQLACADFIEASTRAQIKVTHGALDSEAYAACLRRSLTDGEIRAGVTASLAGHFGAPEVAGLSRAQSTCAQRAKP